MEKKGIVRTDVHEMKNVKDMGILELEDSLNFHLGFVRGVVQVIHNIQDVEALDDDFGFVLMEVSGRLDYIDMIQDEAFQRLKNVSKEKAA